MKKEIFKKVKDSIEKLKKLENRTEFSIWFNTNCEISFENSEYYYEALKINGIDINDFPEEMSFTLDSFLETLKKITDEDLL
jgi:hypothetical protein